MAKTMWKQNLQEAGQSGKAVLQDSQAGLQTLKATGTNGANHGKPHQIV